jgi:hypothetical protein
LIVLLLASSGAYAQEQASAGAIVVTLGKDSPSPGKDSYVTLSLSTVEAVSVGKISTEIGYEDSGKIDFDRAELTPDMKGSGATLDVEKPRGDGEKASLKLTITGKSPIPDGILANVVFKVVNRPLPGKFPGESLQVKLGNKSAAWTPDSKEIAIVTSEPGEVDFEYAPVVFACFFYMH